MFKSVPIISVAVLITTFALLLAIGEAQARIINVPDDFETIKAGIDEAEDGDTVLVQPEVIVIGHLCFTTGDENTLNGGI